MAKKWKADHKDQQRDYYKQWVSSDHGSVYEIVNILTGKKYVGSTTMNPQMRWLRHINDIKKHSNRPLYHDMLEFGIENFKMEVLFTCPKDQARLAEQFVIDSFNGELYNQKRAKR